jgi:hypothetical protein
VYYNCRIKEWARAKLYEAGWREQLKRDGIECVMKKGRENVTVDDLLSTLGDKYRGAPLFVHGIS